MAQLLLNGFLHFLGLIDFWCTVYIVYISPFLPFRSRNESTIELMPWLFVNLWLVTKWCVPVSLQCHFLVCKNGTKSSFWIICPLLSINQSNQGLTLLQSPYYFALNVCKMPAFCHCRRCPTEDKWRKYTLIKLPEILAKHSKHWGLKHMSISVFTNMTSLWVRVSQLWDTLFFLFCSFCLSVFSRAL